MNRFYGWILSGMRPLPEGWFKRSRQAATVFSALIGLSLLVSGLHHHPSAPLGEIGFAAVICLFVLGLTHFAFPLVLSMLNEIAHNLVTLCRGLFTMCKGLWWFLTHLPSVLAAIGRFFAGIPGAIVGATEAVLAMTWRDWASALLFAASMILLGVFFGLLWQPVGWIGLHLPQWMHAGDRVESLCLHVVFTLYIATIPWALVTASCTVLLKRAIRKRKA